MAVERATPASAAEIPELMPSATATPEKIATTVDASTFVMGGPRLMISFELMLIPE